jgi:hypothetical protein
VGDDLCRALGVDLAAIEARFRDQRAYRKQNLREALAGALADKAGTASRLMTEVARCGGRFLAMVEEIYAFLATHRATASGTSEEFRFRKDGVQLDLPISPAFIERVKILERTLQEIEIGTIDEHALARFLGVDNGEFYGTWPIDSDRNSASVLVSLPRAVSQLARLRMEPDRHLAPRGRSRFHEALAAAMAAAERLVARAERLVMAHAYLLRSHDLGVDAAGLQAEDDRRGRELLREQALLSRFGVLGCTVNGGYYEGIEESCVLGVRVDRLDAQPGAPGTLFSAREKP